MAASDANSHREMACSKKSDFAIICSFFDQFGDKSGLLFPSFHDLQHMLENVEEVPYPLVELHVKLMRKLKKSVSFDRWEKAAIKFAHSYSDKDGWEIERFGYKKSNIDTKLRLLKNLLEAQFDGNIKFKTEINKLTSNELRLQPLGRDMHGRRYWHLLDDDCNIRVYREDLDEETWDLVSSDKESMVKLIEQLSSGKDFAEEEETSPETSEESNTNSQQGSVKSETEGKGEGDEPSEAKRFKPDLVGEEEPAAAVAVAPSEPEVSEAIESPLLVVKGEGNGADCETGNPGESDSQSEVSSKLDGSASECNDGDAVPNAKQMIESSETTPLSSVASATQLQTSSPARDDCKETTDETDCPSRTQPVVPAECPTDELNVAKEDSSIDPPTDVVTSQAESTTSGAEEVQTAPSTEAGTDPPSENQKEPNADERIDNPAALGSDSNVPGEPAAVDSLGASVAEESGTNPDNVEESLPTPSESIADDPAPVSSDASSVSVLPQPAETNKDDHPAAEATASAEPAAALTEVVDQDRSSPESAPAAEVPPCATKEDEEPLPDATVPAEVTGDVQTDSGSEPHASVSEPKETSSSGSEPPVETSSVVAESSEEIPPPASSCDKSEEAAPCVDHDEPTETAVSALPEESSTVAKDCTTSSVRECQDVIPPAPEAPVEVLPKADEACPAMESSTIVPEDAVPSIPPVSDGADLPVAGIEAEASKDPPDPDLPPAVESKRNEETLPEVAPAQDSSLTEEIPAATYAPQPEGSALAADKQEEAAASDPLPAEHQIATDDAVVAQEKPQDRAPTPPAVSIRNDDEDEEPEPKDLIIAENSLDDPPKDLVIAENSLDDPPKDLVIAENLADDAPKHPDVTETPLEDQPKHRDVAEKPLDDQPKDLDDPPKDLVIAEDPVDPTPPKEAEETSKNEKPTEGKLTQLTFDYDASAPVPIILPPKSQSAAKTAESTPQAKRRGRKRGLDGDGENGVPLLPVRQSSRIAKLREKEDEERRKQEAERLQRLKEEHEMREKRRAARDERMKKLEEKQQRRAQKTTARAEEPYEESEEDSSSEDGSTRKKGKRKRRRGKKKKDRPWDSSDSSEESSESEEDGLDELHEENEELVFKSDHEFSPESDLDDDPEKVQPTKLARTARAGVAVASKKKRRSKKVKEEEVVEEESEEEEDEEEEEEKDFSCQKCGHADHPEWILLCDRCDSGWHANCVKPPLMVIPEGDWFCPPCDHVMLVERLQERLEAYEFLLQEKEAELERKKELEAQMAEQEELEKGSDEMEEDEEPPDEEDEGNSGIGDQLDVAPEDVEDEESSSESGEDEEEEDNNSEASQVESEEENLNMRRQRRAAKQANYSFKEFDDMIKSALEDDGQEDEEEDEEAGKGTGKGPRDDKDYEDDDDEGDGRKRSSPPGVRPSGIGNKRISTSDDDSDVAPRVIRKKKARKLNDLSASSNGEEDDSDEDFKGSSAEGSDSEDEDEDASNSGSSFVVEDDSDESDVVDVSVKRRARPSSPTIRRSTRNSRKKYSKMDSSDTSEEESEFEEPVRKRKRGNDSWDSSGESSSDASWGRSRKKSGAKGRAKPVAPAPKRKPPPKPKPAPKKAPANRGRGNRGGGRGNKAGADSEDEPFRTSVSVKKVKAAAAAPAEKGEEDDAPQAPRRATRGRQISYKDLISSGESGDENPIKAMGTLFAADRAKAAARRSGGGGGGRGGATAAARGGATTAARGGRTSADGGSKGPSSVASNRANSSQDDQESRFSGSTDAMEFTSAAAAAAAAAAVYTACDDSHTSNDILPPSIDPELATLPAILPQEVLAGPLKEELPVPAQASILPPDLQVSRLIQRASDTPPSVLPPDLHINRLINAQTVSSSSNSPARSSPGMLPHQQRLVRDVLDSQTPPPAVQLAASTPPLPPPAGSGAEQPPLYNSVIKQTARHSLPPTPPLYSGKAGGELTSMSVSSPSVIRPYPTTAVPSSMSTSAPTQSNPGNPLSIQGLLGTASPGPIPGQPHPPSPHGIRPYGNTSHMIGHGPFLNHPSPYGSPYGAVPPPRPGGGYLGTPVTPTPRPAYPPMYSSPHVPPHGLPLHSAYPPHHGPPLRPTSTYQHAGFPQAFAAAAAAAASAEEERRIYRVAQAGRDGGGMEGFEGMAPNPGGILGKGGPEELGAAVPAGGAIGGPPQPNPAPESEFGGLVSYFSSQHEDFGES